MQFKDFIGGLDLSIKPNPIKEKALYFYLDFASASLKCEKLIRQFNLTAYNASEKSAAVDKEKSFYGSPYVSFKFEPQEGCYGVQFKNHLHSDELFNFFIGPNGPAKMWYLNAEAFHENRGVKGGTGGSRTSNTGEISFNADQQFDKGRKFSSLAGELK